MIEKSLLWLFCRLSSSLPLSQKVEIVVWCRCLPLSCVVIVVVVVVRLFFGLFVVVVVESRKTRS